MYSLQLPPPFLQRLSSLSQSTEIAKPPRTEEPTLSLTLNSLRQRPAPQARTALYGSQARPPSTTLKKAPPTVFLTNASAVRTTISCCLLPSPSGLPESPAQNFIPFPTSTPIDFPPPRPPSDVVDPVPEIESANNQNCCTSTEAPKPGVSPVPVGQPEQRKRRLRSFLASSSSPTSSVKLPFKRAKVPKPKSTTKARKSRKQVADLHFMALMHRSIVWHMRTVRTSSMDIDSEESPRHETDSSCLFDQDTLLVERLWQSLIDKGLKPIITDSVTLAAPPNEFRSESPTPTPAVSSPASLNALNEPTSQELPVLASHELPTSPLIPPSSEVTKENSPTLTRLSIPSGQTPSTSSFDPPSGEVDSGTGIQGSIEPRSIRGSGNALVPPTTPTSPLGGTTSEVLPMNRLVASLILRMNDRRASRPRSSSSVQSAQQAAGSFLSSPSLSPAPRIMPRSPLRKTFVAPSPSYL